jgi:APA family basic amino acid/polyamine antiporter
MTPLTNKHPSAAAAMDPPQKSYWRFGKQDFFPEPSFQNLSTYKSALADSCHRLKDRILDRSTDANELIELKKTK